MKVYIITHKEFEKPELPSFYLPLLVGATEKNFFKYLRDDKGENISNKNPNYCELTGLYWIWKNTNEDIIGLCHYRRYFVNIGGKIQNILFGRKHGFYSEKEIDKSLQKYDIIVHNATYFSETVKIQYSKNHFEKDINMIEKIIKDNYPNYLEAFEKVMNRKKIHLLNMFIMRKNLLNNYCEWLFKILFYFEKENDISDYTAYQARVFGFLSERLLDVWILKNGLKVKEGLTINIEKVNFKFWE